MPMQLEGSCQCGAVRFGMASHTPYPYQLCYCSICCKSAGSGGFAINLAAVAGTLKLRGKTAFFHARMGRSRSNAERHYCPSCGSPLWLFDSQWPDLIHPHASAIDTPLPVPPSRVHLMLGSKAHWVVPAVGPQDATFDEYPDESIEEWHRRQGLWIG
jgi:hypothetical protein